MPALESLFSALVEKGQLWQNKQTPSRQKAVDIELTERINALQEGA
jgi:hypothetical protein